MKKLLAVLTFLLAPSLAEAVPITFGFTGISFDFSCSTKRAIPHLEIAKNGGSERRALHDSNAHGLKTQTEWPRIRSF